eukprot:751267-Prymnesium_polylepis.1
MSVLILKARSFALDKAHHQVPAACIQMYANIIISYRRSICNTHSQIDPDPPIRPQADRSAWLADATSARGLVR